MTLKEQARRVQLGYRNIIRAATRRRRIQDYKKTITEVGRRIVNEEYGGGAPDHGWRPPGVVVLDDDARPGGTPDGKHYRTINFRTGLVATDDGDRVDIDVRGGGGFCYDYLVKKEWADEVSAGRGSEGDTINDGFGGTFKVFSTIQAAIDDAVTEGTGGKMYSIGICPGLYRENIIWPSTTDDANMSGIFLYGFTTLDEQDIGEVYIHPVSGHAVEFDEINPQAIQAENIAFGGVGGSSLIQTAGVNFSGHFYKCEFRQVVTDLDANGLWFDHCKFRGGVDFGTSSPDNVFFDTCEFAVTGIDLVDVVGNSNGLSVVNCFFSGTTTHIALGGRNANITITGNYLAGGVTMDDSITMIPATSDTVFNVVITGNTWLARPATNGQVISIDASSATSAEVWSINITGNAFGGSFFGQNGLTDTCFIRLVGGSATDAFGIIVANNTFGTPDTGETLEDAGGFTVIGSNVGASVFGPNTRVDKVKYKITNGVGNLIIPPSADVNGPPSSGDIGIDGNPNGISKHTEHANWKALYTDGSGDQQELALGAAGTVLRGRGTTTAPDFAAVDLTADVTGVLPEANLPDASLTAQGVVELATAAEINTGDDTERAITPKSFADSNFGVRTFSVPVIATAVETTTGDGQVLIMIPKELDGTNLVDVGCVVFTAGTTNTLDVQVRNITKAQDMLSTVLKVASGAVVDDGNRVIDATKDDVSTDDRLTVDIDAVQTTKAKGLTLLLSFQLP